ncbi:MAG: hypothetical protein ACRCX2_32150, partial [Paraclostridium sp.]
KNREKWLVLYKQAKSFIEKNNRYPTVKTNKFLTTWINSMRSQRNSALLSFEKMGLLESLPDWSWEKDRSYDDVWFEKFDMVKKLLDEKYNGKLPEILTVLKNDSKELYRWASLQRRHARKKELDQKRLEWLKMIL